MKVIGNFFSCLEIFIYNGENCLREMEKVSSMKEKWNRFKVDDNRGDYLESREIM